MPLCRCRGADDAPLRYRAPPADALSRVALDGLLTIFDRRSGQTHVVVEPVPAILDALEAPRDAAGLAAVLGVTGDREALALLDARLGELHDAGLIEAA